MTVTLFVTIILEGVLVIAYSYWASKLVKPILFTSICGNLLTQSLLWAVLNLFYQNYLAVLGIAELFIWIIETVLLYFIRVNQLSFKEAWLLSLGMNGLSFAAGWLLPV